MRAVLPAVALLVAVTCNSSAKIIYVDDDANAPGDGTSWQTAYRYLHDALSAANSAERPVEVRVAQGVYKPDRSVAKPYGSHDRKATFQLPSGVTLRGGFAGVGTPDPNNRDVQTYETILSGDLAADDVEVIDLSHLRNEPTRKDNAYHVVTIIGDAEVEGFTIARGHAFEVAWGHVGYAMGNSGGGMYVQRCEPRVSDCTFEGNFAEEVGGGMGIGQMPGVPAQQYRVNISGCRFTGNASGRGGAGLAVTDSAVDLRGCEFTGNWTNREGAGVWVVSGAAATLTGCALADNKAYSGGALAVMNSTLSLTECRVVRNEAVAGGGGYLLGIVRGTFTRSWFEGNKASGASYSSGGGLWLGMGDVVLTDCIFSGNLAIRDGGAIANGNVDTLDVVGCSFSGNRAPRGSFLREASGSPGKAVVQISNCIVADGGNEIWSDYGKLAIRWTDVVGADAAVHDPSGLATWGLGNINADPCFADPGHWDVNGTPEDANDDRWVAGDYHLRSQAGRWDPEAVTWVQDYVTSPCIDAGDPNTPVGLESFPNGGRINMGAYGGTVEASKSPFNEARHQRARSAGVVVETQYLASLQ
ncbi:MAG: right-handed parallel beta-helix repeat-containing protein [Sedimentisphaerales bacterium]|nr:right-handed parallel beta-helix repeat-containing protein [Sedimentisphaerales bacterium]